ncbi:hypothetical protein KNP414_05251 [Paenibacillus mucilaginosus KNP414]|uniref:Uncharacterized protein n=1 Tax=Paenibacillus mucilaginosus (strain KNP414) TaxID=1036673 RepID=F8FC14_PAEMK|nr:hypothetical protein KNP414_05251 [Paenibacillus mucilaginosus KNP414]
MSAARPWIQSCRSLPPFSTPSSFRKQGAVGAAVEVSTAAGGAQEILLAGSGSHGGLDA